MKTKASSRKIAPELGVSSSLVRRKRAQGKSDEQIKAEAKRWAEQTQCSPDGGETFAQAQTRKERALADLREAELSEKTGRLIPAADVMARWAEAGSSIREELEGLETRVASRLPDELRRPVSRAIRDEIRRVLGKISARFMPGAA